MKSRTTVPVEVSAALAAALRVVRLSTEHAAPEGAVTLSAPEGAVTLFGT